MKKIVPFTKEIEFKTMISKITSISLEHTLSVDNDNIVTGYFILEGTYKMTQASQIDEEFSYKIPVEIQIDDKYDTKNINLDIDDFTYEVLNEEKLKLNISLCIDKLEEKEEVLEIELSHENTENTENTDNLEILSEEKELVGERAVEVLDNLFMDTSENINLEVEKEESEVKNKQINDYNEQEILHQNNYETKQSIDIVNNTNNNDIITNVIDNNTMGSLFSSFKDNTETFKTYSVYIVKEEDSIDSIMKKYSVDKEILEEYNDLSQINVGSKIIIPCGK